MRKEEDVVTAPVDMVTFIAENGICSQKQQFFFFTYFTINCNLHLNITIVFDGNVCKYFLLKSP